MSINAIKVVTRREMDRTPDVILDPSDKRKRKLPRPMTKEQRERKARAKLVDPRRMRFDPTHCGKCGEAVIFQSQIGTTRRLGTTVYLDAPGVLHAHQPGEAMKDVLLTDGELSPPYMGTRGEGQ